MKRSLIMLGLAVAVLPLSACYEDGYTYGGVYVGAGYPYYGYYDGYYGSIYDGYWGMDGFFYYRLHERERYYRRDRHRHFLRREDNIPHDRFRPMDGHTRPHDGVRMPRWDRSREQDRDRDRYRDRDRMHN